MQDPAAEQIDAFIKRWEKSGGHERGAGQQFLLEFCDLFGFGKPAPPVSENELNSYTFERRVDRRKPDGASAPNWIDLYKSAHFVLETKQGVNRRRDKSDPDQPLLPDLDDSQASKSLGHGHRGSAAWDKALDRAHAQGERYIHLLPKESFFGMLVRVKDNPAGLVTSLQTLWKDMATGSSFSLAIHDKIPHFNGGLFRDSTALPLRSDQIVYLIHAAKQDWSAVEPAIFGTLLERALDPRERHKLGAHYTPRSYVERLVRPTVIDPLRSEWEAVKIAAAQLDDQGKAREARTAVEAFHHKLAKIRVLDPACGSGNFLYVALELLKRLEAEVLDLFEALGGNRKLEMDTTIIRPGNFLGNFLGIELNPRAAAIAQLVLWIGYFQWHQRVTGKADTNDRPLLPKDNTIECRDAVLAYDEKIPRRDPDTGEIMTIWDGRTTKPHPVTDKDKKIHDDGLVTILKQIHDELDEAVLEAYGWGDLSAKAKACSGALRASSANEEAPSLVPNGIDGHRPPLQSASFASSNLSVSASQHFSIYHDELLSRLVALNHERAAEEKRGLIRWLRPEYQASDAKPKPEQKEIDLGEASSQSKIPNQQSTIVNPTAWPSALSDQVSAIQKLLPITGPDPAALAGHFGKRSKARVQQIAEILETLSALGKL